MNPFSEETLWEAIDRLAPETRVRITYRAKGEAQWESTTGVIKRRSDPTVTEKSENRYADIELPDDGVVLFPQDGQVGTADYEYALIEPETVRKKMRPSPFASSLHTAFSLQILKTRKDINGFN
eukprot:PhM_4_TR16728/c0_g1_i2/m.83326